MVRIIVGGKVISEKKLEKMKKERKDSKSKKKDRKQPKFLKRPKAKGITTVSTSKTLKSFAHSTGPIVREVERREVAQDNRSQFFKSELESERIGVDKWLS